MWSKIKIGESQIPQIMCFIVGLVMVFLFQVSNDNLYAFLTMVCIQVGCVLMACYDEHEENGKSERRANEEAFAMLESKVKSNG